MKVSKIVVKRIVPLYVKKGLSMMQIAKRFHISPTTVQTYLAKAGIQRRTVGEAITQLHRSKFHKKPFLLRSILSKRDEELKIAGTMLYWGEGAKHYGTVQFANSDPEMIKVFVRFLRGICGVSEPRLRALIHHYPDQNGEMLRDFWSSITRIPKENFYKATIHRGRTGTYKKKSPHGTLAINYSDTALLHVILSWIDEYKQRIQKDMPG